MDAAPGITRILKNWADGDPVALERLAPLIYGELHGLARRHVRREKPEDAPGPTSLVNQAWLRLLGGARVRWQDRGHFFAVASHIMRRILVDAARARRTGKRRGELHRVQLNESIDAAPPRDADLVALDDALERLAEFDPRKARVVEMRFFGGLSVEETAAALRVSPQTVMRDWRLARAWLTRDIGVGTK